jgi:hypothetical protein
VVNGHSVRPYCKPDRKEDMQALCKTCWQLVGKLRDLVQAWDQVDNFDYKQITEREVMKS